MAITAPHLSYEELGSGRVRWTVQERDYYQDDSGLWREPDLSAEELVGGWRIFRSTRVVAAINADTGKVRIAPDRRDLNKFVQFDFGLSLAVTPQKDYIGIWREISAWGAGSGFSLMVHPKGLKLLIKFTTAALIPDAVQFGLTASGLTFDGRRVMDGAGQVFRMPDLFACDASDPDNHIDVPEAMAGGVATIDLSTVKPRFAGTSGPWVIDPSFIIDSPVADTYLTAYNPITNYGTSDQLGVNDWIDRWAVSLMRWDLSSFAYLQNIESAILSMTVSSTAFGINDPTGRVIKVNPLLPGVTDWEELDSNWRYRDESSALNWSTGYWSITGDVDGTRQTDFAIQSLPVAGEVHDFDLTPWLNTLFGGFGNIAVQYRDTVPGGTRTPFGWWSRNYYFDPSRRPKLTIVISDNGVPARRQALPLDNTRRSMRLDTARRTLHPDRNGGNLS